LHGPVEHCCQCILLVDAMHCSPQSCRPPIPPPAFLPLACVRQWCEPWHMLPNSGCDTLAAPHACIELPQYSLTLVHRLSDVNLMVCHPWYARSLQHLLRLTDGKQPQADAGFFQRREFCFTMDGDIFVRYQSFKVRLSMTAVCPAVGVLSLVHLPWPATTIL
jgi:hypothetical protein